MHVEHEATTKKCWIIKRGQFCKSINLTTFLIRQLCWIICSDEVLRLGLETIFASLSLRLEDFRSYLALKGYRCRSQANCLETANIARIWLCKTSVIQQVFLCCISK